MGIYLTSDSHPPHELATEVETAAGWLEQSVGLIGQWEIPDDYALVFPFSSARRRLIHTLGVPIPLDIIWSVEDTVTKVRTLPAWWGASIGRADRVIELPAGTAAAVTTGDRVVVSEQPPE